jgi:hypothetical protein
MLSLLEKLAMGFWDILRRIVGLVMPFFSQARDFQGYSRALKWTLHVVVLLGILVGLYFLGKFFDIGQNLLAPTLFKGNARLETNLADFWLPILFLLIYALGWLAWWLWKLLGPEEETSSFPDIDAAWEEAKDALGQAGIELTEVPIFFMLGRPIGGEAALLQAADLRLVVKQTPSRGNAPVKVFANHEGIYITCAGASLLGKQAAILSGEEDPSGGKPVAYTPPGEGEGGDGFQTLRPAGKLRDMQGVLARAREQGRGPEQLTEDEKKEIRMLVAEEEKEHQLKARRAQANLIKNTAEVERCTARLEHVCRLITRDRRPYCPLNGVMALLPFAGGDNDDFANQTAEVFQRDLATTRRVFKVQCPTFAILSDLETADGFREFIDRFPEGQKQRRVGQRFPLLPDLPEADSTASMVDRGVAWICQALFPNWVYKMFRIEAPGQDSTPITQGNVKLYELMSSMRERQRRFSRVVTRWLTGDTRGLPLFGGCYVAGTGKDPDHEQAFVPGVFRRLIENQDFISWNEQALKEDEDYNTWATRGYLILGVALIIGLAMLFYTFVK